MMTRHMNRRPPRHPFDMWLELVFVLVIKPTLALVECLWKAIFGGDSKSGCCRKGRRR